MKLNSIAVFAEYAKKDLSIWENLIDCEITHKSLGVGLIDNISSSDSIISVDITFINLFDINKTKAFYEYNFLEGDFIDIEYDLSLFSGFSEFHIIKEKEECERLNQQIIKEKQEKKDHLIQEKIKKEVLEQALIKIKEKQFDDIKKAFNMYQIKSFWYMIHIDSLLSIISQGIYCRNLAVSKGIYVIDISDEHVQLRRIPYHKYVNLYFADNTPMLYVVSSEYGEKIVLLELDPLKAIHGNIKFTDGNAASNSNSSYVDLNHLCKLDWDIIKSRQGAYSQENKRIRAAEFLIENHVDADSIKCIHVQSSKSKEQVNEILRSLSNSNILVKIDLTKSGLN